MNIFPFENHLEKYEEWFENNYWAYQSELFALKKYLPKQGLGIEIGVGSGRFAGPLGITIGVDPSRKMRELAQTRGIKTIEAKAENLPFYTGQFNFALMVTTTCFVDNLESAFKEVFRVLTLKGKLIIGFVDKNSSLGKLYHRRKDQSLFYQSAKFYSTEDVVFYLKKAGFHAFDFSQTIFKELKEIQKLEPIKKGYGNGSFVVLSAWKR